MQASVDGTAKDWTLQQTKPAARTLTLQLTRFFLDESNKALGSVYAGEVKFAYTLKDARGNVLAEGATSGTAIGTAMRTVRRTATKCSAMR